MKKIKILVSVIFFYFAAGSSAQSLWNKDHLEKVKQSLTSSEYAPAYKRLLESADRELSNPPLSVMMKEKTPASGSKHDYMSIGRYYWPDPTKPDGKPYINRDGVSNPELEKLDRVQLGKMADAVTTLSLAYYFSHNEKYAAKATECLRVWFMNKSTKMNPNLNYAQTVPGRFNDRGRCYGVIDTYSLVEMLEGVQLLSQSKSFTDKDEKVLKAWFGELVQWLVTSDLGKEESNSANNHGLAYDVQLVAFAIYTGNHKLANEVLDAFPQRRLYKQIEPDGSQPLELKRTLAFGYSEFNIHHMIDLFFYAKALNRPKLYLSQSEDGRSFLKAVDFLTPYLGKKVSEWPYQQISEWDGKQQAFCDDLYKISLLAPSHTDYMMLYKAHKEIHPADRNILLY